MRKYRYELIPGSNPRIWTPVWYDEPVATVKKVNLLSLKVKTGCCTQELIGQML